MPSLYIIAVGGSSAPPELRLISSFIFLFGDNLLKIDYFAGDTLPVGFAGDSGSFSEDSFLGFFNSKSACVFPLYDLIC